MTDASLPRLLSAQTPGAVGCINLRTLHQGVEAVTNALAQLQAEGMRHIIVDTLDEADLNTLAQALHASPLLAGAPGLAARWPPAPEVSNPSRRTLFHCLPKRWCSPVVARR